MTKKQNMFGNAIDLLAEKLGGKAIVCSDDFFAGMENLVKEEDAIFIADKYTERGKWMDGWESRRKRVEGHDWVIVKLGVTGQIDVVDIDTSHFLGNHAPIASIEYACDENCADENVQNLDFQPLLDQVPLQKGSSNYFVIQNSPPKISHLKLHIYPDGGVARLRCYGKPAPSWKPSEDDLRYDILDGECDLAALRNGGQALICSDMFFGVMSNLIAPGRARVMGEGWETRRSRRIGFDWIVVQLGTVGNVSSIVLDTNHFKGNFAHTAEVEGIFNPNISLLELQDPNTQWTPILPNQHLQAHFEHQYRNEIVNTGPFSHVRLRIYPDGGVSRMRIYGKPV